MINKPKNIYQFDEFKKYKENIEKKVKADIAYKLYHYNWEDDMFIDNQIDEFIEKFFGKEILEELSK